MAIAGAFLIQKYATQAEREEKKMGEFKPIESQEQLDAIIKERLERAQSTYEKKFENYLSPDEFKAQTEGLNSQIATLTKSLEKEKEKLEPLNKQIESLNNAVKKYETDSVKNRITAEFGLPFDFASRLNGETEDEIRKDAEIIKGMLGSVSTLPMADPEGTPKATDETNKAIKSMVKKLREQEK